MNTILILSAGTWLILFVVRYGSWVKVLRRVLTYILCVNTGWIICLLIVSQTPLAAYVDAYAEREFPGLDGAANSAIDTASDLKNKTAALLVHKTQANTNTSFNPTPPPQP